MVVIKGGCGGTKEPPARPTTPRNGGSLTDLVRLFLIDVLEVFFLYSYVYGVVHRLFLIVIPPTPLPH